MSGSVQSPRLVLRADTAADLMTSNPVSLRSDATIRDALGMMLDRDVTAAPVINEAGRPLGVVTVTDILVHEREVSLPAGVRERIAATPNLRAKLKDGFQFELADPTTVEEIMTPGLFSVAPDRTAAGVVADMLRFHVHHLFVVQNEVIVGVISTTDVLRRLGV